ncbi:MAG: phytoene desaturase family protein [Corynebacterium pyruviciproducens]|uniref:phytoene desaturase family protein n=1 Tax=Corynebacterium pyruviciproducens TaxID=598660 RepID=UPI003982EF0D
MSYTSASAVVVIGGGVTGLATAGLAARAGYHVTLVEKLPELGGRVGTLTSDGYRWDTGPSWWLMPEAYDHFFELMGTSTARELDLIDLDPAYRVVTDSYPPVDVRTGMDHVAELADSLEPGAGDKLRAYLDEASLTYRVALSTFLYTTFTSVKPFLDKEITTRIPLLIRLLTRSLKDDVEINVAHPVLRMLLEYPAVFVATRPDRAPSMYKLLSHTDLIAGVKYPQGGYYQLIRRMAALAEDNGAMLRTGTVVTRIVTAADRVTGVQVLTEAGEETIPADIVVSTADLHHTETALLPPRLRSVRSWRRKDPGISSIVALLGVADPLPSLLHHTLSLSDDWSPDFAAISGELPGREHSRSVYVCKASATDPTLAPQGCSNIFILIPTRADPSIGCGSAYNDTPSPKVEAIVDEIIELVATRADAPALASKVEKRFTIGPADFASRYNSWQASSIGLAHTLWQSAFLRGKNESSKVKGLLCAGGTTVPGVGVPLCLISAENVIKRLRGDSTSAPLTSL